MISELSKIIFGHKKEMVGLTKKELWERMKYIEELSGGAVMASKQYGMYFLLSPDNEIIFQLNALLERELPADDN